MCPLSHVFGCRLQQLLLVNAFFPLSLLSHPVEPRVTPHALYDTLLC